MVNLTRIYTRTGDDGSTRLGDMSKTTKNDPRLVAYADVDEANSSIGVAIALGGLPEQVEKALTRIQNELFDVGADLCNPVVADPGGVESEAVPPLRIEQRDIDRLERDCDTFNADLPNLRSFILPGGTSGSALLHVARTVTRRAERSAWAALDVHAGTMNPLTAKYLNRLSDLLFILARVANQATIGDVLWQPGATRSADDES
jgi:cob(I)alamin adenosyltransferase